VFVFITGMRFGIRLSQPESQPAPYDSRPPPIKECASELIFLSPGGTLSNISSTRRRHPSFGTVTRVARPVASLAAAALFYVGTASMVVGWLELSEDIAAGDRVFAREAQPASTLEMSSATLRVEGDGQTERQLGLMLGGALGFFGGGVGFLLTRTPSLAGRAPDV
jgi:hypothetical protein